MEASMNREEALKRALTDEPITDLREVVFVLAEVQRRRTVDGTPAWYLLNSLQRHAMAAADVEERGEGIGGGR
jgi:hypothetical protein